MKATQQPGKGVSEADWHSRWLQVPAQNTPAQFPSAGERKGPYHCVPAPCFITHLQGKRASEEWGVVLALFTAEYSPRRPTGRGTHSVGPDCLSPHTTQPLVPQGASVGQCWSPKAVTNGLLSGFPSWAVLVDSEGLSFLPEPNHSSWLSKKQTPKKNPLVRVTKETEEKCRIPWSKVKRCQFNGCILRAA